MLSFDQPGFRPPPPAQFTAQVPPPPRSCPSSGPVVVAKRSGRGRPLVALSNVKWLVKALQAEVVRRMGAEISAKR